MAAWGVIIAAASTAIVVELLASFTLSRSIRAANQAAIESSSAIGTRGKREKGQGARESGHYLRGYAPLSLRLESAAKVSPRDASVTLVFESSPGAPEAELAKDILAGSVSRLLIAGVLVDVVDGSRPSIDLVSGNVAIRVARASSSSSSPSYLGRSSNPVASDSLTVQPVALSLGAEVLTAFALSSPESTHPGGVIRVIVVALP